MTERSAAITEVFDVLVATFPARPTDQAVEELQEDILTQMERTTPRGVILDIADVMTLDSFFARAISETAQMIALLGGDAIVVGMRPEVAITASQLGFGLEGVTTARNTDHALEMLGISVRDETNEHE
jgi:rsbT antagonist protein RsbS